jgi:hypothetical protein
MIKRILFVILFLFLLEYGRFRAREQEDDFVDQSAYRDLQDERKI